MLSSQLHFHTTVFTISNLILLSDIQARLASFYRSLPAPLAFNHVNLEALSHNGQGSLLLMLHLMFHGVNALVNWPSIFREFDHPVPQNVEVAYAVSLHSFDNIPGAQYSSVGKVDSRLLINRQVHRSQLLTREPVLRYSVVRHGEDFPRV